jgi:recombination protein RecA
MQVLFSGLHFTLTCGIVVRDMPKKKFDLQAYKSKIQEAETPLKSDKYIKLNEALQEVLGLPGLPLGHVTQIYGPSDSGKTTMAFHAAAQAQKQNILPIFIITEAKVSWDRAEAMGVDVENCIIIYTEYLEDIFKKIDQLMADVTNGNIPMDVMFFIDSIGNSISVDSVKNNKDGTTEIGGAMMKAARVIRERMRVISHKINNTRKITSPKVAGLVFINHSYKKPPAFPGGPTTDVPYGGAGIFYASSLVLKTTKGKRLDAVVSGQKKKFGLVSKIAVEKNHISEVSNVGEFIITADEIFPNEKGAIDDYKNRKKDTWNYEYVATEDGEVLNEQE